MKAKLEKRVAALGESYRSPSPRPSSAGRGRIALSVFGQRESEFARRAPGLQRTPTHCPLSQRERARVRESMRKSLGRPNFRPIKAQI